MSGIINIHVLFPYLPMLYECIINIHVLFPCLPMLYEWIINIHVLPMLYEWDYKYSRFADAL